MRYEPETERHEFLADVDDESSAAVMSRMRTLQRCYQRLRDSDVPRTAAELGEEVDLTESRVETALGYLAERGKVERVGDRYVAVSPRWGRLTPVVRVFAWLPRRILRPAVRIVENR